MAHTNKQQPDFSSNSDSQDGQKPQALARDIENLNHGLRVDFDQKLGEISDLLARFKSLVLTSGKTAANDDAINQIGDDQINDDNPNSANHDCANEKPSATVTPLFGNSVINSTTTSADETTPPTQDTQEPVEDTTSTTAATKPSRYAPEPARFETGLYKLNCQLYRFRLELDQEMEFREEPLHLHFQQESDLSKIFQELSDKSSEKHPDN